MFKKIVSQLSFSPALVGQLGFYAKRLRKEQATRRIGLIFVALALVVQSLVVFQAPEPANASNNNDMVIGGLGYGSNLSINNYLAPYDRNDRHLKDITNYFGITRAEIQNSKFGSFRVGSNKSYGFENRAGSTPISITNANFQPVVTLYGRPLTIWGNSPDSTKAAFIGHSAKIGWFAILQDCGNIITPEYPRPPVKPAPANITGSKSGINNTQGNADASKVVARENNKLTYTVTVRNTGGTTGSVTMNDNLGEVLKYSRLINAGGGILNGTTLTWGNVTLEPGKVVSKSYTVQMNSSLISTTPCVMTNNFLGNKVTVNVGCKAPPANVVSSKSAVNVTQKSVNATTVVAKEKNVIRYTVTAKNTGGTATAVEFQDDLSEVMKYATLTDRGGATFNDKTKIISWGRIVLNPGSTVTKTYTVTMKASLDNPSTDCQMRNDFLDKSVIIKVGCTLPPKPANVSTSKKAINVTQKKVDATKATAKMNDVITYTITAKNTGGLPSTITMSDDLSDVLEFATLTNNGGGTFDKQAGTLTWGKVSVGAGKTVTKSYTVKMKPSLISAVLNCTMKNKFMGNTVTIPVGCSTPPADIKPSKTASNVSQGNVDATTVTAKENDRITFTLTAENVGGTAKAFTFTDELSDALEYAKLVNNGGGTFNESTKTLTWPTISLKPGAKEVRTFTMQILATIPATPAGLSDPSSYDCRIENTFFAASVMIPVTCAPPKVVEVIVGELPTTGASENMIFAGILFAVVVFFYLRSRQLGTEVRLIRRDLNGGTI